MELEWSAESVNCRLQVCSFSLYHLQNVMLTVCVMMQAICVTNAGILAITSTHQSTGVKVSEGQFINWKFGNVAKCDLSH